MKRQIEWMVYGIMLLLSVGCREDVDALYGVKSRPGDTGLFHHGMAAGRGRTETGYSGQEGL